MIWRPWRRVRELERELADARGRCSMLRQDLKEMRKWEKTRDKQVGRYRIMRTHVRKDGRVKQAMLQQEAEGNARSLTRQKGRKYEAYKCQVCEWYHVGHKRDGIYE